MNVPPFPTTAEEAREWKPTISRVALASTVLAVATTRQEGMWTAYCAGVPGQNHNHEWREVLDYGDKLPEHVASAIFPQFADIPYAR